VANRIYDNVIGVDSAMGNLSVVGGSTSNITSFSVIGISFRATDTLGRCIIAGANTLDFIADFGFINAGSGIINAQDSIMFGTPLRLNEIKCPTLTSGSARIYLS
jgi:hypothetical protein